MSEEVDTSIVNEEQDSPMEAESETAGQQSNGDAEEDTKQEESSPKKKVKENASPKKKLKEDASPKKKVKEDASPKKKLKEDPSPKKKVDKDEDKEEAEEDGDDESSEEEELPLGSIEAPVQIMTGKRERKKTERLVFEESKKPQESMKEIKPGKGTKLGEIPNVSFQINKTNSEFLKPLNSLLFGFIGKMTMVKKNVRQFSGFQFEKDDPEYKKKEQKLFKFTLVGLKELCIWFDLERGGTKDQICDRILAFLLKPEPSGRPLPEKKKKAVKKPSKKRKRKEDGSGDGDGEKKSKKEKKEKKASENDEDAANDSVDSVSSLSPDSDEEDEEPKKKKAKVEKKTPKKAAASPKKSATPKKKPEKKKTPKKASTPKTKTPKKTTPKKAASYDSDSSDDEPLVKKKSAPSESQIKDTIKKFLAKANLEEVTMKIVCKKVYETYPDFDLTHKKDFIKSTVKTIIS